MAGSEKNGPQHGRADLFQGCVTIVTPTEHTDQKACRGIVQFWKSIGAKVIPMAPREHDRAVASISHLPHLVAAALSATTPPGTLQLAAGGWRDTTRIAAGDPVLWRQILSQNRFHVLEALDAFTHEVEEFRRALTYDDGARLEQLLTEARNVRALCRTSTA